MNQIKQKIMDEIEKNVSVFIPISQIRSKIRCPYCGDSQKNPREAHLYIKHSNDPTEPLLFNCFKCNVKGRITENFLDQLGIKVDGINQLDNQVFNKISGIKKTNVDILTGSPVIDSSQVRYIEHRLGKGFTAEDYDKFKIVWDIGVLIPYISDIKVKHTLPSNRDSISFLSEDKSTLITRFYSDQFPRWKKMKLFNSGNKTFYTIKTILDLFTNDTITVNIGEGVFDVLSIYKNFNTGDNSIYISTLDSNYVSAVEHIISLGIIGSNVDLRVYLDSNIQERFEKGKIKKIKWLFNKISLYKNTAAEDVGVHLEKIKLIEYNI